MRVRDDAQNSHEIKPGGVAPRLRVRDQAWGVQISGAVLVEFELRQKRQTLETSKPIICPFSCVHRYTQRFRVVGVFLRHSVLFVWNFSVQVRAHGFSLDLPWQRDISQRVPKILQQGMGDMIVNQLFSLSTCYFVSLWRSCLSLYVSVLALLLVYLFMPFMAYLMDAFSGLCGSIAVSATA